MSGYLYFNGTGNELVDNLLSAIEQAGNAYHHTEYWGDPCSWNDNKSYVDTIQEAAQKVADFITEKENNAD